MAKTDRIQVVDDEVNARTALAELRDEGHDVETTADAFEALGKYESFSPHVVITDLEMPDLDGIELVRKICALDDPAAVLVMAAFGAVETAVDAMRAGAAEYLTKPLNFDELLSTSKAAEILDISLRTIQYRLHDYNAAPRSEVAAVRGGTRSGRTAEVSRVAEL